MTKWSEYLKPVAQHRDYFGLALKNVPLKMSEVGVVLLNALYFCIDWKAFRVTLTINLPLVMKSCLGWSCPKTLERGSFDLRIVNTTRLHPQGI